MEILPHDTDLLTSVLKDLRISGAVHRRTELTAPWGFRAPPTSFAAFYAVTEGEAYLEMPALEEPVWLGPGDLVIRPGGLAATLRDHPESPAVDVEEVLGSCTSAPQTRVSTQARVSCEMQVSRGGDGPVTTLIIGKFEFEEDPVHPFLEALPPLLHLRGLCQHDADGNEASWLDETLQILDHETTSSRAGSELTTARLTEVLFIQAVRAFVDDLPEERFGKAGRGGWLRAMSDPQIGRALAAMHQAPRRDWTVASLAGEALMSRTAFAMRFAELMGEPPMEHLRRWRMHEARRLLRRDESATVAEAASVAGYASPSSFSKAFKRHAGTTPGAFRKLERASEAA